MADPILVTDQQGTTNAKPILVTGIGGGGESVIVDSSLSISSKNPVQNRVITNELNKKLEKVQLAGTDLTISNHTVNIPVDNALSSTSTNPVQNKMVLDTTGNKSNLTTTNKTNLVGAINEHDTEIGTLSSLTTTAKSNLVGAVNELDGEVGNLASLTTTAKNTIVASINELDSDIGDKTTLKTTAKTNIISAINENYDDNTSQQNEIDALYNVGQNLIRSEGLDTFTTNGVTFTKNIDGTVNANGTASASASAIYDLVPQNSLYLPAGKYKIVCEGDGGSTYFLGVNCNGSYRSTNQSGYPNTFELTEGRTIPRIYYQVVTNYVANNVKLKGMLLKYDTTTDSYIPIGMSFSELTNNVNALVGDKNISLRNSLVTAGSVNGVDYTLNSDGSYTLNGTTTQTTWLRFNTGKLPKGNYILTGTPSGGSLSTYYIEFRQDPSSASFPQVRDVGSGVEFTVTDADVNKTFIAYITIQSGITLNNVIFSPMIKDARISDSTYTPPVDTGWINMVGDYMNFQIRKKNGYTTIVYGSALKQDIPVGTTQIGTIPSGFLPNNNHLILATAHDLSSQALIMCGGDAKINARATTAMATGKTLVFSLTYPNV